MSGKRSEFPARGTLVASQQPDGSLDPGGRAKRTTSSTMPRVRASIPDAEYFQAMAELSPDFIGMLSPQGAFLYVNPAGRQMCGIEPSVSLSEMTLADFHPPGDVLSKAH